MKLDLSPAIPQYIRTPSYNSRETLYASGEFEEFRSLASRAYENLSLRFYALYAVAGLVVRVGVSWAWSGGPFP